MNNEMLDAIPLWGLPPISAALLCLAMDAGYRLGRFRHARTPDEKEMPVGAMVASILGLLAFVLAFTFSLAASRFEARRQVLLEEANAVSTTYLRARLLPEPQRTEVARLLREYVDVRLKGVQEGNIEQAVAQSEALQESLWTQAVTVGGNSPNSIMAGLFIQSLNEMIDLHAKRMLVGIRSRIPFAIWFWLIGLALLGMSAVGYQAGLSATRRSPAMLALVLTFVGIFSLIADLDRAHKGLLRVGQQALVDVQRMMHSTTLQQAPTGRP